MRFLLGLLLLTFTAPGQTALAAGSGAAALSAVSPDNDCRFRFRDIARESGIDFVHVSGARGDHHLPETMGAGLAWLDWDSDGWLDLVLVQSGPFPPTSGVGSATRLYRNLGPIGGVHRFAPLAIDGFGGAGYGQGVVSGDLDGDGALDLVLTGFGADVLLLQRGGLAVERRELEGAPGWSTSAALGDLDGDSDLDLYVAGYLEYDPAAALWCGEPAGIDSPARRDYCDPSLFAGRLDRLYLNDAAGSFGDRTIPAGLASARGKGLGVVVVDLDGDSRSEIYVANDITANHLFRNLGGGRFEDVSLLSGAAVNADGKPEAGMGIAAFDPDGDGDIDLAVTNFDVETNTLYRNDGDLSFEDISARSGFGLPSFNRLGFGIVDADFDLDGKLDVYVANGHIFEHPKRDNVAFRQPDLWLAGDGRGGFSQVACAETAPAVARGAAGGDFDSDGDTDLLVSHNNGPPSLLENQVTGRRWLGVELIGQPPDRQAIGARVSLRSGETVQHRWVLAGASYLSDGDRRLRFAIPSDARAEELELDVRFPSGRRLVLRPPATELTLRVSEPGGVAP